jgi:hypothetical protein
MDVKRKPATKDAAAVKVPSNRRSSAESEWPENINGTCADQRSVVVKLTLKRLTRQRIREINLGGKGCLGNRLRNY